jgi:hypothetical protein
MSEICECCQQPLPPTPGPVTVDELRDWCRARGYVVLPDDLVRTEVAAVILGMEPQSLRVDRMKGNDALVPFVKHRRRVYYRLAHLC